MAKKRVALGIFRQPLSSPAKPLGCYGDGGAIFTDNDDYFALMQSLAVHGKGSDKYDNVRIGYNSRLDTVQAAVLEVKLEAFESYELDARNRIAKEYTERLNEKYVTPLVPARFYFKLGAIYIDFVR